MEEPTDEEKQRALEVLEWLLEHTQETEPHAVSYIDALEHVMSGFPTG